VSGLIIESILLANTFENRKTVEDIGCLCEWSYNGFIWHEEKLNTVQLKSLCTE